MKVYGQFYGGSNYSVPYPDEYEVFDSLREARQIFDTRVYFDPHYPGVDVGLANMQLWIGEPEGDYPCDCPCDYEINMGPRGGVQQLRYR